MGLARERLEVVALGGVAELLDVGVVDLEAELVELALDVAEDAPLWWVGVSETSSRASGLTTGLVSLLNSSRSVKISSMVMDDTRTRVSPSMMPLTMLPRNWVVLDEDLALVSVNSMAYFMRASPRSSCP